jgi:dTDP-4-amino-4,6-dideoxygalactose transaminase
MRAVERWLYDRCNRQRLVENRRRNYLRFVERLSASPDCRVLFPQLPRGAVPYVVPLHVKEADTLFRFLRRARLPAFRWDRYWPATDDSASGAMHDWGNHVIQVACHQDLSTDDVDTIADGILTVVREARRKSSAATGRD